LGTPVKALFANVPRASSQWMAAQVAALLRINIDFLNINTDLCG